MLNAIIHFSLRYRMLVIFLSLVALLYGGYLTATLPIDVFPDLDRPRVVILTEAPNLAPEDVETLITYPIESAVLGATGVQAVRSQSTVGLSVVNVEFDWGVPIFTARQIVQERLSGLEGTFPAGIRPQLGPISSLMGQIMLVGISRQTGPSGGELAMIGKRKYMAELVHDEKAGRLLLAFWNPRDDQNEISRDTHQWKPVSIHDKTLSLRVVKREQQANETLLESNGNADKPFVFNRDSLPPGQFQSTDARLASPPPRFRERERRLSVSIDKDTFEVAFPSQMQQQLDLRTTSEWIIRPRLLKIPGMAQVMVMGGGRKQYQVLVDPMALMRFDVTLQQVEESLKKNNINTSGGYAIQGDKEKPIRVFARLGPKREQVLSDLEQIVVKPGTQRNILVKDVARVAEGEQLKRGDCSVNGDPSVVLNIMKQPHKDTRALTVEVVNALKEIENTLSPDIVINPEIFQMKGFIDRAIFNVGEALVIGAVLVLIVLFLFLLNYRTTFISLTAIPLSLVVTGMVFKLVSWLTGTELSINVMTLGGIAVAMGELVDDAIVDVENIFRRLRENNLSAEPRPAITVIYEASIEVRGAIVFGTIMVILVFVPLFAMSGIEGRLFAPLGLAYIVSILASLLISLTVTPVLSYYLLPQATATHETRDSPVLRFMKWLAAPVIRFSMSWPGTLLLTSWSLVAVCGWLLYLMEKDFLPQFDEGSEQINLVLPPGSSLEASNQLAQMVDAKLRTMRKTPKNPNGEILQFVRRTGRAEYDETADPVNNTEYLLTTNPDSGKSREEIIEQLRADLKNEIPGVEPDLEPPLQHLIGHMLTGSRGQIVIGIYGDDLDILQRAAAKIKKRIKDVPGVADLAIDAHENIDELHIKLRPEKLSFHGLDRMYVADFISTALKGEEITQVIEGQRRFAVIVRLEDRYRTNYANFGNLRLELPDRRGTVALKELATIQEGVGANQINRENARRRITVHCNAPKGNMVGVANQIKERVEEDIKPNLAPGYSVELSGQFQSQASATRLILLLSLMALVGMFVVLYMLFPSTRIVLQILNALPTAFIGGVLALLLTRQTLTVASMVGFISLGGIAARNGILLVTHYIHLMKYENEAFTKKMILRGSLERLSPVLMTALTAGIGLIPLVYGGQEPGREILYPVATVILGGLITSTFCEFLLHPGLFWQFSGRDADGMVQSLDRKAELL